MPRSFEPAGASRFLSTKNDEALLTAATRQEAKAMRQFFRG